MQKLNSNETFENPTYKGIMRLPLNIIYTAFCGITLAGNTLFVIVVRYKWRMLFAKTFG